MSTGSGHWIRPLKRHQIYLRDGVSCVYCGIGPDSPIDDTTSFNQARRERKLTLDHLKPRQAGGSNEPNNLVTCCAACNGAKQHSKWRTFVANNAASWGREPGDVIRHIVNCTRRKLPLIHDFSDMLQLPVKLRMTLLRRHRAKKTRKNKYSRKK